jgi:C4-dicarboxylate transporter DctQ subunit
MNKKAGHLTKAVFIITKISLFLGYISSGLVFIMMLSIVYDVAMRHVFDNPTIWADEVSGYFLVAITFLGAAYTLTVDGHIRIETFVERLKKKKKKGFELIINILSLSFLVVFGVQAFRLTVDSYMSGTRAPTLLRMPYYIPQLLIAIGLTWLCLQMVIRILQRNVDSHKLD